MMDSDWRRSGTFEDLNDGLVATDFQDLPFTRLAIAERDVDNLSEFRELEHPIGMSTSATWPRTPHIL